ncbi:MAG: hypothetical protein GF384_09025 [Elusimicrobia bacterium]|nr:hypothetical protein [Elusimicrobiota bacterium]
MMKKFVGHFMFGLLVLAISPIAGSTTAFETQQLSIFVEGDKVHRKVQVYLDRGFGYVRVKDIAAVYGMTVDWRRVSRKAILSAEGSSIEITEESTRVIINGTKRTMNRPAIAIQGKLCVPLELILAQSFNTATRTTTEWNDTTYTLTIDKKVNVEAPQFYTQPHMTRIIVEYADYVTLKERVSSRKVILKFINGVCGKEETIAVNDGAVKKIRIRQNTRQASIVISLHKSARDTRVSIEEKPNRVIVDVMRETIAEAGLPAITDEKNITVVIDPGHGGKDPGAIGRNGTKEKDLNLKIGLRLAKMLKKDTGWNVILTRDDDTFIPLFERADIANKNKADLFVSLHCNASLNRESEGFEIYFLSGSATDKAAAATARLENSALELEENSRIKKKKVDRLLWSIAKNLFHRESAQVCAHILQEVQKRVKIKNRFAKQARFYVLMNAQMPSVLIETGFLSNRTEEARLKSRRFQTKMVNAYYAGIVDYFNARKKLQ